MPHLVELLLVLAGFAGGWLLVAGPVYQASIELDDQESFRPEIDAAVETVQAPRRVSPWWWLLPPVGFLLQRRRTRRFQRALFRVISPEQVAQWVHLTEKATGWFMVSGGGLLLALRETGELVRVTEAPAWVFWPVIVVLGVGSALFTVVRQHRSRRVIADSREEYRRRPPTPPEDASRIAVADDDD